MPISRAQETILHRVHYPKKKFTLGLSAFKTYTVD